MVSCIYFPTNFLKVENEISDPLSVPVPPLTATIPSPMELVLVANQAAAVTCEVTGSRPPPDIAWWVGGERGRGTTEEISSADGSSTISRLTFTPRVSDHGRKVRCRASNPSTNGTVQDARTLAVNCKCQIAPGAPSLFGHQNRANDKSSRRAGMDGEELGSAEVAG